MEEAAEAVRDSGERRLGFRTAVAYARVHVAQVTCWLRFPRKDLVAAEGDKREI